MRFSLSKYILPSVISMVLVGAYTNIDGLFIGNAAGDDGIAAINIVWPVVAFITSLGTGIGVGGSVIVSSLRGKGEDVRAGNARRTALLLLFFAGILSTLVLFFAYPPLLRLLGAAGLVIHILLDWLLVGKYVLYGVAVSTVAAQAAVMLLGLCSFRVRCGIRMNMASAGEIVRSSLAPFGVNFVSSLVLLFTNYFALRSGGTAAVSAYGVMSYAVYTYDYVFQGVCDGVQPVISYCAGAGDAEQKKRAVRSSVLLLAGLSVLFALITPLMIGWLPKLFAVSAEAEAFMRSGLVIYACSYPLKAGVKFLCAYHYSHKRVWLANVCTYIDPLIFTPLFLAVLPLGMGMNGIWAALPLTQLAVFAIGAGLTAAALLRRPPSRGGAEGDLKEKRT